MEPHISLKRGQFAFVNFQLGRTNADSGEQPLIIVKNYRMIAAKEIVPELCEANEFETIVKPNTFHEASPDRQKCVGIDLFKIT